MRFHPQKITKERALFYGENSLIMQQLAVSGYQNQFDLIYFDGPFNSGRLFSMPIHELETEMINSWNELKTIQQFTSPNLYITEYRKRIELAYSLLKRTGVFVLQTSQKEGHYLKILLDEIFGRANFLGEMIWKMRDDDLTINEPYSLNHESLFFYSKTKLYKKPELNFQSIWTDVGYYESFGDNSSLLGSKKPEKLIERIIEISTEEGALIGDFYCGSGTLPFVAEKMSRRWIASDHSRNAVQLTKKRLEELGVHIEIGHLVDDFDVNLLHNGEYTKTSVVPFSLYEFNALRETVHNQPIRIHAYDFTSDIDSVTNHPHTFHYIVPVIGAEGISGDETTTISRPILKFDNGSWSLDVPDVFLWILYNIKHVDHNEEGEFIYSWDHLRSEVQRIQALVGQNWINSADRDEVSDVFGHVYQKSLVLAV
ncbi:DNA methyltransferase [Paenibacillus cremeus]|nr:site-specific DNA-methyltransferase [Paenibacillus cremeus]